VDAARFGRNALGRHPRCEQDGVDHLGQAALRLARSTGGCAFSSDAAVSARRFRSQQLLDAGIAARRTREQPARLLRSKSSAEANQPSNR